MSGEVDEYNPSGFKMTRPAYLKQAIAIEMAKGPDADWIKISEFESELGPLALAEMKGVIESSAPDRLYGLIEKELADEDTDYNFISECYLRLDQMNLPRERPKKSTEVVENEGHPIFSFTMFVMGLALVVYTIFLASASPMLLVMGAAMMGLPALVRATGVSHELTAYIAIVLTASTAFSSLSLGDVSNARAKALRTAQVACERGNQARVDHNRFVKVLNQSLHRRGVDRRMAQVPLADCQHLQGS